MSRNGTQSTGIKSIEVGMALLTALLKAPDAMALKALAKTSGMTSSKAHKYLASFVRVGLVTQDEPNGNYRLGSLALELGFAALRHLNVVDVAQGAMAELCDELKLNVSLTVWSNQGPTLVRRLEARELQSISLRLGTVLPLLISANGRIFLAYLERDKTQAMIEAELNAPDGAAAKFGLHNMQDVDKLVDKIRMDRLAETDGFLSALTAVAAPIFDSADALAAALTIVGRHRSNLHEAKSRLRAAADDISQQLGAPLASSRRR